MNKIVPLIGSAEVGPLGVLHLPRLWLKVSLDSKGLLADGYPAVGTGFDQMVLDGLGLQKEAVVGYIMKHKPTYPEFETWIKQQPGTRVDAASIAKLNQSLNHPLSDHLWFFGLTLLPRLRIGWGRFCQILVRCHHCVKGRKSLPE